MSQNSFISSPSNNWRSSWFQVLTSTHCHITSCCLKVLCRILIGPGNVYHILSPLSKGNNQTHLVSQQASSGEMSIVKKVYFQIHGLKKVAVAPTVSHAKGVGGEAVAGGRGLSMPSLAKNVETRWQLTSESREGMPTREEKST